MKTTTLALAAALISFSALSSTTLQVRKGATLCNGNSCSYTNLSYDLSCDFTESGIVKIKKTQTFSMVGPTIPLLITTKFLTKSDAQLLSEALAVISSSANTPKISSAQDNVRYTYLGREYAINERYILSTPGTQDLWLAQNFSQSSRQIDLPEVDQVVEIADLYCSWTFLTKK